MIDKQIKFHLHEKDAKKLAERLREYSRQITSPRFHDDLNLAAEMIDLNDYQQRYEALVQALRVHNDFLTADSLVSYIEFSCPFVGDLREDTIDE